MLLVSFSSRSIILFAGCFCSDASVSSILTVLLCSLFLLGMFWASPDPTSTGTVGRNNDFVCLFNVSWRR